MPAMVMSKVTERSQTTLPSSVRKVLDLHPGEHIGYVIEGNEVRLVNASAVEHVDPAIESFLAFLARDIEKNLSVFPESLVARARALSRDVHIDHDAPIDGDVGL